jgi:hypothetical protein
VDFVTTTAPNGGQWPKTLRKPHQLSPNTPST